MNKRRPDIIARGPEMKFQPGSWQAEHYLGRPMYEQVQDGQYFPEGAGQRRLDELAEWAARTTSTVASLELPELAPEQQVRPEREAVAA